MDQAIPPFAQQPLGREEDIMQVDINGIHLTVSEELDGFIRKKVEKITKYLRDSATCHVTLKSEKERYEVEVSVALKGTLINGKDTGNDLQTCVE